MWNHMMPMGYGMGGIAFLWMAVTIWFVLFTFLVIGKLNAIIRLLESKK